MSYSSLLVHLSRNQLHWCLGRRMFGTNWSQRPWRRGAFQLVPKPPRLLVPFETTLITFSLSICWSWKIPMLYQHFSWRASLIFEAKQFLLVCGAVPSTPWHLLFMLQSCDNSTGHPIHFTFPIHLNPCTSSSFLQVLVLLQKKCLSLIFYTLLSKAPYIVDTELTDVGLKH